MLRAINQTSSSAQTYDSNYPKRTSKLEDTLKTHSEDISRRVYINSGDLLPGTLKDNAPLKMPYRSGKSVYPDIHLTAPQSIDPKTKYTIEFTYRGLVHICNCPEKVEELAHLSHSINSLLLNILSKYSQSTTADQNHFYVQTEIRDGIKNFNVICYNPLFGNNPVKKSNLTAVLLVLSNFKRKILVLRTCYGLTSDRLVRKQTDPRLKFVSGLNYQEYISHLQTLELQKLSQLTLKSSTESTEITTNQTQHLNNIEVIPCKSNHALKVFREMDALQTAVDTAVESFEQFKSEPYPKADVQIFEKAGYKNLNLYELSNQLDKASIKDTTLSENIHHSALFTTLKMSDKHSLIQLMKEICEVESSLLKYQSQHDKYKKSLSHDELKELSHSHSHNKACIEYGSLHKAIREIIEPLIQPLSKDLKLLEEYLNYSIEQFKTVVNPKLVEKKYTMPSIDHLKQLINATLASVQPDEINLDNNGEWLINVVTNKDHLRSMNIVVTCFQNLASQSKLISSKNRRENYYDNLNSTITILEKYHHLFRFRVDHPKVASCEAFIDTIPKACEDVSDRLLNLAHLKPHPRFTNLTAANEIT